MFASRTPCQHKCTPAGMIQLLTVMRKQCTSSHQYTRARPTSGATVCWGAMLLPLTSRCVGWLLILCPRKRSFGGETSASLERPVQRQLLWGFCLCLGLCFSGVARVGTGRDACVCATAGTGRGGGVISMCRQGNATAATSTLAAATTCGCWWVARSARVYSPAF